MSPDDPRHGEYRGYLAHRRERSDPCVPCRRARLRFQKAATMRRSHGIANRIPLGERAWGILTSVGCSTVALRTGLGRNNLYRIQRSGPQSQVLRSTRDSILTAGASYTPIGIQRRLQALARLGWSMEAVAEVSGRHVSNLRVLTRRHTPPMLVKRDFAEGILRAYDELHMKLPERDAFTTRQINRAAERRWPPPLAWNDIDDPNESPRRGENHARQTDIDPVVVERVLAGDILPTTRAEKIEITRRWEAQGRSLNELERTFGWKSERYTIREKAAS